METKTIIEGNVKALHHEICEAINTLAVFFEGFEESSLYEDYVNYSNISEEDYEEAWAVLVGLRNALAG